MGATNAGAHPERDNAPWPILIFVPLLVGAVTGVLVGIMVYLVEDRLLEHGILKLPSFWFAVPLFVVIILTRLVFEYVVRARHPGSADLFPKYYHDSTAEYPARQGPGRVLAAATTVGLGGSQGLEAASAVIGDSMGTLIHRIFRTRLNYLATPAGRNLILVSGAAAGIATVFSSPILGAAFGIEMPFKNRIDGRRLIASLLAATASFASASLINRSRTFMEYVAHDISLREIIAVLVVAIVCGLGARAFVAVEMKIKPFQDGALPWLRALSAGCGLFALAIVAWSITGAAVTSGPGYVANAWALPVNGPSPSFWLVVTALVARSAAVLLCVAAGGGGGIFTSLATNGLLIGVAVADLFSLENPTLLALAGACAFLGAGYRLPLATAGLAAETAGAPIPTAFCLAAIAISLVFMADKSASNFQSDADAP